MHNYKDRSIHRGRSHVERTCEEVPRERLARERGGKMGCVSSAPAPSGGSAAPMRFGPRKKSAAHEEAARAQLGYPRLQGAQKSSTTALGFTTTDPYTGMENNFYARNNNEKDRFTNDDYVLEEDIPPPPPLEARPPSATKNFGKSSGHASDFQDLQSATAMRKKSSPPPLPARRKSSKALSKSRSSKSRSSKSRSSRRRRDEDEDRYDEEDDHRDADEEKEDFPDDYEINTNPGRGLGSSNSRGMYQNRMDDEYELNLSSTRKSAAKRKSTLAKSLSRRKTERNADTYALTSPSGMNYEDDYGFGRTKSNNNNDTEEEYDDFDDFEDEGRRPTTPYMLAKQKIAGVPLRKSMRRFKKSGDAMQSSSSSSSSSRKSYRSRGWYGPDDVDDDASSVSMSSTERTMPRHKELPIPPSRRTGKNALASPTSTCSTSSGFSSSTTSSGKYSQPRFSSDTPVGRSWDRIQAVAARKSGDSDQYRAKCY
mmetsp:Transcript_16487/g.32012  ORF Transcript_16487/g.32012 Transcript_16487/m.32012 type:complete len:483 (+) Transcript_16487:35-1483(+)